MHDSEIKSPAKWSGVNLDYKAEFLSTISHMNFIGLKKLFLFYD